MKVSEKKLLAKSVQNQKCFKTNLTNNGLLNLDKILYTFCNKEFICSDQEEIVNEETQYILKV